MEPPRAVPPLHRFLPKQEARTYAPVGKCVYCGATTDLSDEHIVPFGLGGRWVLPKASCNACSVKTSKVERTCLRTMLGPLRLLYGLPSRRKDKRPETLQLKIKRTEKSDWEYVPVAQERFPFLITLPRFDEAPGFLSGTDEASSGNAATDKFWIRGASPHHHFSELLESLVRDLQVHMIMPEAKFEVPTFCSMLAKIALGAIVANGGRPLPGSRLAQMAVGENMPNTRYYIGTLRGNERPSQRLHEVSIGSVLRSGAAIVRIRLLAKLGTPTYLVVAPVGVGGVVEGPVPRGVLGE
jgi:hypothetical protein